MKDSPVQFTFASVSIDWSDQHMRRLISEMAYSRGWKFVRTRLGAAPGLLAAEGGGSLGAFLCGFCIGLLGLPHEVRSPGSKTKCSKRGSRSDQTFQA